jgi:WD40 repeat protein
MIWLVNVVNGKIMGNFIGHEEEVTMAQFTRSDGGKQIISASGDGTIRVWSPLQSECIKTIRNGEKKV